MTLQHGSETLEGSTRALWIAMIEFLSQSNEARSYRYQSSPIIPT
jgi:hypothetical protein